LQLKQIDGHINKSKLDLESNLSEILPFKRKFIRCCTPT